MPVPPAGPAAPYDSVNTVLNTARTRINDAIVSLGGEVLTNNQPFTQQMTITAWRKLQAFLANNGYSRMTRRALLKAFPVVDATDPATECRLDWTSYRNASGAENYPPATQVLPQDLILPLTLGERVTGTQARFVPVDLATDGRLPDWRKRGWNGWWLWREDAIYLPGSLNSMDLEVYYAGYLPDFATVGTVQWYEQPVPIMRSLSALANYVCAEFAGPRGDMDAGQFVKDAEQDARLIFNTEVRQKQRVNVARRGYSGRNRGSRGGGSSFGF